MAMMQRAADKPRQEGMMVHFLPKLSATWAAGITPTRLTTAMPANMKPAGRHTLDLPIHGVSL